MERFQLKNKVWNDKKVIKREIQEGDLVLASVTCKTNKLTQHWSGPGKVLGKLSDTNYVVELPERNNKSQVYHVNMLKPYYKSAEQVNFLLEEGNSLSNEEMEIPYLDTKPISLMWMK
ncbi:hypothetical protein AVEN_219133-1 [Araneus ventricosus]|uniref:Integrase p58-like C-terminal domain-containing protein n=1 Tax=Araneus ventricosus TaxID=182803 RepID=A0A4Y2FNT2_ARAVE|nr:hypothetical protein AVEN_219133-1 [Araneus ventricosus]